MHVNKGWVRKLIWMRGLFRPRSAVRMADRRERFENVMAMAKDVAAADPLGLSTMVRLIAAPLHARAMASAAYQPLHKARSAFDLSDFIGLTSVTPDGLSAESLIRRSIPGRYRLRLGRDPILSVPWKRPCLANAVANIGHARRLGQWRARSNHKVELLLPFGLGLVHGGNHSLAAGIANAEGTVIAQDVTDLSPLYEHLRYDGMSMVRTHDGCRLWEPIEEEFGILFEIGRLMVEQGVRYDVQAVAEDEDDGSAERENFPICYRVSFDGKDTGYSLSSSGATRALLQAGVESGSAEARSVILDGKAFTYRNREGKEVRVELEHYGRRPLVDDLKHVIHMPRSGYD